MTSEPIPEEIGKIVAYQYAPCKDYEGRDTFCWTNYLDHLTELPVRKCSNKKQIEVAENFSKKWGTAELSQYYAEQTYCVDLKDAYIAGEPTSASEASLIVAINYHPDIVIDPFQPGYDWKKANYFENSVLDVIVDFSQVNMKKGTLERVSKTFKMLDQTATGISLGQNKLIDRNDSFGLIPTEPEPKTFFTVEQSIGDYQKQTFLLIEASG